MRKTHNSIRKKRNEFLLDIVSQFKQSGEKQTIFDCYDYVKIITDTTIESFMNILTEEERTLVEINTKAWFIPTESIRTFAVFLSNNEISLD
jgi:hypothetical protein